MHKWNINSDTIAYQLMAERSFFEQFAPFFRFSFTNYQNNPVIKLSDKAFNQLMYEFEATFFVLNLIYYHSKLLSCSLKFRPLPLFRFLNLTPSLLGKSFEKKKVLSFV